MPALHVLPYIESALVAHYIAEITYFIIEEFCAEIPLVGSATQKNNERVTPLSTFPWSIQIFSKLALHE
jgi:hypothetical protein